MNPAKLRRFLQVTLATGLACTAAQGQGRNSEEQKAQTVMIQVRPREGSPELGSGIILCKKADKAYILTARHVVYGRSPEGKPLRRTLGPITQIQIEFYRGAPEAIVSKPIDEAIVVHQAEDKRLDLLLLEVRLDPELPVTAHLGIAPSPLELTESESPPEVSAVGWRTARAGETRGDTSWAESLGVLVSRDSEFLYHSSEITKGFSGGPLFDSEGALIGVNVEVAPGFEVPKGDPQVEYGRALPIESARETIFKWTPASCWGDREQSVEIAYQTYRKAMRAISTRRWGEAETLLSEAVKSKNREGGAVHLNGMRYTEYLPHFHLGLALYKGGRRCEEALDEWYQSEIQEVIQKNKRYRNLKKYRDRCRRLLRERFKTRHQPAKP